MLKDEIMLKSKQYLVYICGDTNAKTSTCHDYICMDKLEDEIMGLTSNYDTTTQEILIPNLMRTERNYCLYVNRQVFRFKTESCPNLNIRALYQMVPAQLIIF